MPTPAGPSPIDALAAPGADGQCLFHPDPSRLADLARKNRAALSASSLTILNRPLADLREPWTADGPVVMVGHQPEWMHPGVWAKNVAAVALAGQVGGRAVFLVVDSDVPGSLAIAYPDESAGRLRRALAHPPQGVTGRAFEHIAAGSTADWAKMFATAHTVPDTALKIYETGFLVGEPKGVGGPLTFFDRWYSGLRALDSAIGIASPHFVRISDVFSARAADAGRAAMTCTASIILQAREFAAAYNAALKSYRDRREIRGTRHPIPDLERTNGAVELPFWVVHPDHPRRRLFVRDESGRLQLNAEQEPVGSLASDALKADPATELFSALGAFGVRPRALAQTLFTRLVCCDLFIHGVGGAKYDQITDELIRRFFRIEPPAYTCVSATLRLPLKQHGVTLDDVRAADRRARDLRFNPQRYLDDAGSSRVTQLVATRESAIEESQRLRSQSPGDHRARRSAYNRIREANSAILNLRDEKSDRAPQSAAVLVQQLEHDRIAGWREWFYALQPLPRLQSLRDTIVASF